MISLYWTSRSWYLVFWCHLAFWIFYLAFLQYRILLIHLGLKSHWILLTLKLFLTRPIILIFSTECSSDNVMHCTKFENKLTIEKNYLDEFYDMDEILIQLSEAWWCVSKLTVIGPYDGLLPGRHQAIIWTNARILLIGPFETNFSEIFFEIYTFSFKKMHL